MGKRKPQNRGGTGRPAPPAAHRFSKGRSGNPGGRPALADDVKEYLRLNMGRLTVKALVALDDAMGKRNALSITAAQAWLKKALPDLVEVSGNPDAPLIKPEVVNDDDPKRLARILALIASTGAIVPAETLAAGDGPDAEADGIHSPAAD